MDVGAAAKALAPPVRVRPDRYWKYSQEPVGLSRLLQERELRGNGSVVNAACQGHGSLVRRLQCEEVLEGHTGCVNNVKWNQSGSLLASGSDDTRVIVWDYYAHKKRAVIESGHRLNIFAVCFVPGTNDHIIASGAMDNDVRIHYAPFRQDSTKLFRMHRDRVKDIASSWAVPQIFWTAAEDGLVYQFDLRALPQTNGRCETPDTSGALIRLGRDRNGHLLRGMGMTAHPLDPTKVALACGDFYTRLYDRRMLRVRQHVASTRSVDATEPTEVFAPPHLALDTFCDAGAQRSHDRSHGTSIQFSSDGSEILANYHNDHIYLFKVGGSGPEDVKVFKNDTKHEGVEEVAHEAPGWHNGMQMDDLTRPLNISAEGVERLHAQGIEALSEREYRQALEVLVPACTATGVADMAPELRKELHHDCAKAYIGRLWNADGYLAAVHCKKALEFVPGDRDVELTYVKALHAGRRQLHAKWQSRRYQRNYPEHADDVLPFLANSGSQSARRTSIGSSSHASRSSDDSDSSDSVEEPEPHEARRGSDSDFLLPEEDDDFWTGGFVSEKPVNCDVQRRYIGYCNVQTDIKEATFFGRDDAYIVAGSDDGRALIWDKATGELVNAIEADADIVNCVQVHPTESCLATSGIEDVIRLWTPTSGDENTPTEDELREIVMQNQSQMDDVAESFQSATHNMVRLVFQSGGDHQGIQECATS